eukprot:CAMPEP_0197244022 /NCGR_PEP_ID=MMETSP1429-20130617/9274_1 /TAXON_ID=49237 /ORGANISM="Chaetoceros  sp., Strain UNC1202" /LENGTH=69 /DNA_ID=CAMNT_0042704319 /DNA_START=221 /DNA_END=430 /DNA_ORIENTATION=-
MGNEFICTPASISAKVAAFTAVVTSDPSALITWSTTSITVLGYWSTAIQAVSASPMKRSNSLSVAPYPG